MAEDLLSNMLGLLGARCEISGRLVAGNEWSARMDGGDAIAIHATLKGTAWYQARGMSKPAKIDAGDVVVAVPRPGLVFASAPDLVEGAVRNCPPTDELGYYRMSDGDDFIMVCAALQLEETAQNLLMDALPVIHLRGGRPEAAPLAWLMDQLVVEMGDLRRPGRQMVVNALVQLLFVSALRAYLTHASADEAGWLSVFGDARLTAALNQMHADPSRRWSLDDLARAAGMSRTAFAVRFHEIIGAPPATYLTQLRMRRARNLLQAGASVTEAAAHVGYASESAFSAAFKRSSGLSPGAFRRA